MEQNMKSVIPPAVTCVVLLSAAALAAEAKKEAAYEPRVDKDGWEILFDGKDLNAWDVQPDVWTINEQGELTPAKGGRNIYTKLRYCDFVIELDFKVAANKKSNSGVFLRVHNNNDEVNTGMEIQVLDDAAYNVKWDAMNANGALYDLVHPSVSASNPPGEWNHYKITVNDGALAVELNGKEIVKADLNQWTTPKQNPDGSHNKFPHAIGSLPREGFIGLQNYGGVPVWYRNIRLKSLSDRKPQFTGKEPIADVLGKAAEK
jgi:hypothetical protein